MQLLCRMITAIGVTISQQDVPDLEATCLLSDHYLAL